MDRHNKCYENFFDYFIQKDFFKNYVDLFGQKYIFDDNGYLKQVYIEKGISVFNTNLTKKFKLEAQKIKKYDSTLKIRFVLNGSANITINLNNSKQNIYKIKEKNICFCNLNDEIEKYEISSDKLETLSIIINFKELEYFNNPEIKSMLIDNFNQKINENLSGQFLIKSQYDEKVRKILEELKKINLNSITNFMKYKSKIFKLIDISLQIFFKDNTFNKTIAQEIDEIIERNYEIDITAKYISEFLNTSIYKIRKLIKYEFNMSLNDYIINAKLKFSKELLKNSSLRIIDVSNKIGYANPSKFSKQFRKLYDESPNEYRKNLKYESRF